MSGKRNKNSEGLVTVVTHKTWLKIALLLRGSKLTPVRWLGLVARHYVRTVGFVKPFSPEIRAGAVDHPARADNVRIVASVPLGVAGPHQGLVEAEWGRALVEWALADKVGVDALHDECVLVAAGGALMARRVTLSKKSGGGDGFDAEHPWNRYVARKRDEWDEGPDRPVARRAPHARGTERRAAVARDGARVREVGLLGGVGPRTARVRGGEIGR